MGLRGRVIMDLKKFFKVSNATLLLYFSSAAISYFCWRYITPDRYEHQLIQSLITQGGYYKNMDAQYHSFNAISGFLFFSFFQIFIAIGLFFINLVYKKDTSYETNFYCNISFISFSVVNVISVIIYFAMIIFYFLPPTALFYSMLLIVFVLTFCMAALLKRDSIENPDNNFISNLFKKLDARLLKYDYSNSKIIFFILWISASILPALYLLVFRHIIGNPVIIKYISSILGFIAIAYLLISRHYKMKKMDELQRLIQLEHANIIFNGFIVLLLGTLILSANFNIKIDISDIFIPITLLMIIALIFSEAKYK